MIEAVELNGVVYPIIGKNEKVGNINILTF